MMEAKAQMDLMNKMDGASGYDLATTRFGEIGGHSILFMIPALALFAAVANKKKGYIIYPILCGFCIFVNATYTGPIETGAGALLPAETPAAAPQKRLLPMDPPGPRGQQLPQLCSDCPLPAGESDHAEYAAPFSPGPKLAGVHGVGCFSSREPVEFPPSLKPERLP